MTASLVALYFSLRVATPPAAPWREKLGRIDFIGNAIFMAATVAVLIGVTWGGTVYPWKSANVIVPLVFGFVGIGLFLAYEWTLAKNPSLPQGAIVERTAATVLAVTFLTTLCTYWAFYFMPIYFQGVLAKSTFWSGVDALPLFAGLFPFAIIGGILLSKFGRYKPLHLIGMAIVTISFGLFSLLDQGSSTAAWACFQLLCAIGSGLMIAILLPAMQAPLDESLVAVSTGVWTFIRAFSTVWGVTIPAAIFDNEVAKRATSLTDQSLVGYLTGGKAYQYATQAFLDTIHDPVSRAEVIEIFSSVRCSLSLLVLPTPFANSMIVDQDCLVCGHCLCRAGLAIGLAREGSNSAVQAEHKVWNQGGQKERGRGKYLERGGEQRWRREQDGWREES